MPNSSLCVTCSDARSPNTLYLTAVEPYVAVQCPAGTDFYRYISLFLGAHGSVVGRGTILQVITFGGTR
jgi:hypothetical protein